MTQVTKVKQSIHEHKDRSWNPKTPLTNSRLNRAVWTVFVVRYLQTITIRCCQMEGRGSLYVNVIG